MNANGSAALPRSKTDLYAGMKGERRESSGLSRKYERLHRRLLDLDFAIDGTSRTSQAAPRMGRGRRAGVPVGKR